jgi:7-cyano-7-deazaguanine synthase
MKGVVILSGGVDSTTLLYQSIKSFEKVYALTVDYGQRHSREVTYAGLTTKSLGVEHTILELPELKAIMQGSSLTSDIDVPEGHYASETMKSTVVPNRNMLLISLATSYAISKGANTVLYGAHQGDHAIYPDCKPIFVQAMGHALQLCHFTPIYLSTPFLHLDKGAVVALGISLGVNYALTWTCYKGNAKACGKCGACIERLEAFAKVGIKDPIDYE